ncbi:hypothetical protein [uncultured Selenomonas sp.]|uniref:hypothetical protein n=1 Tax=uncultured Selenomonas sp. TaxID=159275 RepID=UPI002585FC06|nr:hypothetical protein [uncultured Selenomonas sp.]
MTARIPPDIERLRTRIYDALDRGDTIRAKADIELLRRDEPGEAAGLLTALFIECGSPERLRHGRSARAVDLTIPTRSFFGHGFI